jgi:hypothetical protein
MAMSDLYPGRKRPLIVSKVDIDALKKRFEGFPVPEGPFDFSADPERLADFGLPPKPDAAQTLRLKAWERGFGKPVALQPFKFDDELVERIEKTEYRLLHRQADEIRLVETRFESSSNWSGANITANHNRRFLQIWGTWTIPGLLRLPPGPFQGPPGKTYVCSNWIGLDGQRRYLDSSLPQIGTQSTLQGDGTTTAEAWVQWWARGGANDPPLTRRVRVAGRHRIVRADGVVAANRDLRHGQLERHTMAHRHGGHGQRTPGDAAQWDHRRADHCRRDGGMDRGTSQDLELAG